MIDSTPRQITALAVRSILLNINPESDTIASAPLAECSLPTPGSPTAWAVFRRKDHLDDGIWNSSDGLTGQNTHHQHLSASNSTIP